MKAILIGGPLDGQEIEVTKGRWSYEGYYRALSHRDCAVFLPAGEPQESALPALFDMATRLNDLKQHVDLLLTANADICTHCKAVDLVHDDDCWYIKAKGLVSWT